MKTQRDLVRPSLFDHYYIEGMGRVRALKRIFERELGGVRPSFSPSARARVLDLGGRESPYERLAQGYPVSWISTDIKAYARSDAALDVQALPFKDGSFNVVLCTQVFGYVSRPSVAAEEIRRILKPGGVAIFTEAAVLPPWGEGARWRILPEGWKTLLSGFSTCDVDADCKTIASFFRVVNLYLCISLQNIPILEKIWRFTLCPLLNVLGRWANEHLRDIGFAANYIAVARK